MQAIPRSVIRPLETPAWKPALTGLAAAVVGYILSLTAVLMLPDVPYVGLWLAIPATLLPALFIVKLFTIQHDCGHRSYSPSPTANRWIGRMASVLTLVPFGCWATEHNQHHAEFTNLDRAEMGDITLVTEEQFFAMPRWQQWLYRIGRHPMFLLMAAPYLLFLVRQRWSIIPTRAAWLSVLGTNVALLALYAPLFIFGTWTSVMLMMLVWYLAGTMAIVLFYIQHQFEDARWTPEGEWDFSTACMHGCSFLTMPRVLHWFSGNIGYHHLHHLSSRIPSYRLPEAQRTLGHLLPAHTVTLLDIPRALNLSLWSEAQKCLVPLPPLGARGTVPQGTAG